MLPLSVFRPHTPLAKMTLTFLLTNRVDNNLGKLLYKEEWKKGKLNFNFFMHN